tara:strand:+ start:123 stop:527 length:405 start_codon:yes stop_codon:yes gene_type:complete
MYTNLFKTFQNFLQLHLLLRSLHLYILKSPDNIAAEEALNVLDADHDGACEFDELLIALCHMLERNVMQEEVRGLTGEEEYDGHTLLLELLLNLLEINDTVMDAALRVVLYERGEYSSEGAARLKHPNKSFLTQ